MSDFGWAIEQVKGCGRVRRAAWSDTTAYVSLSLRCSSCQPYLYLTYGLLLGQQHMWFPSQEDMFAIDWVEKE
jgi:Protein of unknown function (DUF2829)